MPLRMKALSENFLTIIWRVNNNRTWFMLDYPTGSRHFVIRVKHAHVFTLILFPEKFLSQLLARL